MAHYTGTAGDDALTGTAQDDTFDLTAGGNDTISGGAGNDTFIFGSTLNANDVIDGGSGNDTVVLDGDCNIPLSAALGASFTSVENLVLSAGHDYSLAFSMQIASDAWFHVDASSLASGNALTFYELSADAQQNPVYEGKFFVKGGAGNDAIGINGGAQATLNGGSGDDSLLGGAQQNILNGGDGDDSLIASSGILNGGTGNDELTSSFGKSTSLNGGAGNDTIYSKGNDTISGGSGDDAIHMSISGDDVTSVDGGSGNDTLYIEVGLFLENRPGFSFVTDAHGRTAVSVNGVQTSIISHIETFDIEGDSAYLNYSKIVTGDGDDLIRDFIGQLNTFNGGAGDDIIDQHINIDGYDTLIGGTGNDTIYGGGYAAFIYGGPGNDTLVSNAEYFSVDVIKGGTGDDHIISNEIDTIDGGAGNDSVTFDYHGLPDIALTFDEISKSAITEMVGYSTDFNNVHSTTTATNVETFDITGGDLNDSFSTLAGNDRLDGDLGDDILSGGAGDDTLIGGAGADTMTGGPGHDAFVYNAVQDSTGVAYDTIVNFYTTDDHFVLPVAVEGVDADVTHGFLGRAAFDTNLAVAIGANELLANHAVLFTPDRGPLKGDTFLIVDANGVAGYQAGGDFVIRLQNDTHLAGLSTANFTLGT